MSGLFVTVDGPGGAGKSTLLPLLGDALAATGHRVHLARQPSNAPLGQIARHETDTYNGLALAALVTADRFHQLDAEIEPILALGGVVVCDRYVPSSYVLQNRDGVPLDYLRALNRPARRPDVAVLLTADPEVLEERLTVRGAHSRFEHGGSSRAEVAMYDDLADILAEDGFTMLRVDTGEFSPQEAVRIIHDHINALLSRPTRSNSHTGV